MRSWLLLASIALLPFAASGQSAYPYTNRAGNGPAGAGDPPKLSERLAADRAKADAVNGTVTNPALVGTLNGIGARVDLGDATAAFWGRFGPGELRVSARGNTNGIIGMVDNNLPSGTVSYPTGGTFLGRISAGSAGNAAFGSYSECHSYDAGVCAGAEIDTFNWFGAPTDGTLPPNRGFGVTQAVPISLTLGAGGAYPSLVALQIVREGSTLQQFLNGVYFNPDSVTGNAFFVDATATVGPLNPVTIAAKQGATNLWLIARGSYLPSNPMATGTDGTGIQRVAITQGGSMLSGRGALDRGVGAAQCVANGQAVNPGDAQACRRVLRANTSGAVAVPLTVEGGAASATTQIPVTYGQSLGLRATAVVTVRDAGNGQVASWDCRALLASRTAAASGVAVVGTASCTLLAADSGLSGASVTIGADTTYGTLAITGTGVTGRPLLWTAAVDTVEF